AASMRCAAIPTARSAASPVSSARRSARPSRSRSRPSRARMAAAGRRATTSTLPSASIAAIARRPARSTRSSRDRISSSPPRRARSCSTTRTSCSRMATAGRPRSPLPWLRRLPTDDPPSHHVLRLLGGRGRLGGDGGVGAQPGAFGVVPDPRLFQRRRTFRADGGRVPGDDPGRRLCRRGRRVVPLCRDDARHRFRAAAQRVHPLPADRLPDRRGAVRRAGADLRQLGDRSEPRRAQGGANHGGDQYPRARRPDLYALHLRVPDRRGDPAGRDDRRHRADPAPARRVPAPVDRGPARPHPRAIGRGGQGAPRRQGGGRLMIGLGHYLTVAAILFTLGIFGIFLNRKNVIIILMSIELMLLAVNINLVAFSTRLGALVGQIFAMFVLTVAAAEAAIGLAILVVYFRNRGTIRVEDINVMKG